MFCFIFNCLKKRIFYKLIFISFFIINTAKAHGNIDIFPTADGKVYGAPFFGFSTGVNFYDAYRGEGKEEINTIGNSVSAFAGYAYGNFVFIGGYEHSFAPITYNGSFNSLKNGNFRNHPEFYTQINYYITRQYMFQPYLIAGLSLAHEIDNNVLSESGLGVYYNFGSGFNVQINDKWSINYNAKLLMIKHTYLPLEMFIKTGIDIGYQVTKNLTIVYALTYTSPRLNDRRLEKTILPVELDVHGDNIFSMELGFVFS